MYPQTYGATDRMDHLIQKTKQFYKTWKYWHAPMLHAKELAILILYDFYSELFEGGVDNS